mgnify:CR=1 FL=1
MAGRYLNAIYCDPAALHNWIDSGADLSELPISDFTPPCEWDTTTIGNKEVTLYPFNRHALLTLYESLATKSPRMFLKNVIRAQLKEYFDGKQYGMVGISRLTPVTLRCPMTHTVLQLTVWKV